VVEISSADCIKPLPLIKSFAIASILSLILILAGPLNLSPYTQILISLALIVFGGRHFLDGFRRDIRNRVATLDTLASLSLWAAFLLSSYAVFAPETLPAAMRWPYWVFIIELIILASLGKIMETRIKSQRSHAVLKLKQKIPTSARILRAGKESFVFLSEIASGDRIIVRKGEEIPVDGICRSKGAVDESLLNDRTALAPKSDGAPVWAGSFVRSESLEFEASGSLSLFSLTISAILKSEGLKSEISNSIDRKAAWLSGMAVLIAVMAATFWAIGAPSHRVLRALASLSFVLILACPPALALSHPIAWIIGFRKAARNGMTVFDPNSIDRSHGIDTLLFDKTGVLTEGRPEVSDITLMGDSHEELLSAALSGLQNSPHLSAQAVARYARNLGAKPFPEPDSFESIPGQGVLLKGRGGEIRAGNLSWIKEEGCPLPPIAPLAKEETLSLIGISRDSRLLGYFALKDSLRPEAANVLKQIKALGITPILVSGDRNDSVHRLAEQTGIRRVFAEVAPGEKEAIVRRLQAEGKRVALIGSSFYDAAALSVADFGIAWELGNQIAKEAADIMIKRTNLSDVLTAIRWSQRIRRTVRENVFWAVIYSVLLIPVACGFFYWKYGLGLEPSEVILAGILGLISVTINSIPRMNGETK
jgi:heavy metal translocating P-type ATPase